MTNAYEECRRIQGRLDELWEAGLGESGEADLLRERGSDLYYVLTPAEREALNGAAANPAGV